jgi:uncharacterized protein (TIGR00297 family)
MLDLAGTLVSIFFGVLILISPEGWRSLLLLIAFLVIGSLFTRYKYEYKKSLSAAEPSEGGSINPVVANGIVPTFFAVLGYPFLLLGSLSAALADIMATEIGLLHASPRLITTGENVKAGTRGAISLLGEVAAALGSLTISAIAVYLYPDVSHKLIFMFMALVSGMVGCNADSVLGASIPFLSKEEVNVLVTLTGAAISGIFLFLLPIEVGRI